MLVTFEQWTDHTQSPKWAKRVAALIWNARPGSIFSPQIEEQLGISGNTVRGAVHYLRTELSAPICSEGRAGYFWALNASQLDNTILHGKQRIRSIADWVAQMEQVQSKMRNPPSQLEML